MEDNQMSYVSKKKISSFTHLLQNINRFCGKEGVKLYSTEGEPLQEPFLGMLNVFLETRGGKILEFRSTEDFHYTIEEKVFSCKEVLFNNSKPVVDNLISFFTDSSDNSKPIAVFNNDLGGVYVQLEEDGTPKDFSAMSSGEKAFCWLLSSIIWGVITDYDLVIYFTDYDLDLKRQRNTLESLGNLWNTEKKPSNLILILQSGSHPLTEAFVYPGIEYLGSIRDDIFYKAQDKKREQVNLSLLATSLKTNNNLIFVLGRNLDCDSTGGYEDKPTYPLKSTILEQALNNIQSSDQDKQLFEDSLRNSNVSEESYLEQLAIMSTGDPLNNPILETWRNMTENAKIPKEFHLLQKFLQKGYGILMISTRIDGIIEKALPGSVHLTPNTQNSRNQIQREIKRILSEGHNSPALIINCCGINSGNQIGTVQLLRENFEPGERGILDLIFSREKYSNIFKREIEGTDKSELIKPPILFFSGEVFREPGFREYFHSILSGIDGKPDYYLIGGRPCPDEVELLNIEDDSRVFSLPLEVFLENLFSKLQDVTVVKGPDDAYFPFSVPNAILDKIEVYTKEIKPNNFQIFFQSPLLNYLSRFNNVNKSFQILERTYNLVSDLARKDFYRTDSYYCSEFVDHGRPHILNLLNILTNLLSLCPNPVDVLESQDSLFLLISATLLHDIGMSGPPENSRAPFPKGLNPVQKCAHVRANHTLYATEWIDNERFTLSDEEIEIIKIIIVSHSGKLDLEKITDLESKIPEIGEQLIPLSILCLLLRFSDELDYYYRSGESDKYVKLRDIKNKKLILIEEIKNRIGDEGKINSKDIIMEVFQEEAEIPEEIQSILGSNDESNKVLEQYISELRSKLADYKDLDGREDHLKRHWSIMDVKIGREGIMIYSTPEPFEDAVERVRNKIQAELQTFLETLVNQINLANNVVILYQ